MKLTSLLGDLFMQNWDLAELIRKYSNSIVSQDVLIAQKLKGISELASKCKGDEYVFANEIIAEFCRVINFIEKQNENIFCTYQGETFTVGYDSGFSKKIPLN